MIAVESIPSTADRWPALAELAVRGLRDTYAIGLPHTMKWSAGRASPAGTNVRYALISLIGLGRSKALGLEVGDLITTLWSRVNARRDVIAQSPGDLGLALWAQALTNQRGPFGVEDACRAFQARREMADSVHLAWLMLGAGHCEQNENNGRARELADVAKADLLILYNANSQLFYRHARRGFVSGVSRRVSCFANQIYPVMALAVHGRCSGDDHSAEVGRKVADTLCALQGRLGQWWWLYDAQEGGVVDGYPVFSVHQDGMAPMALFETTKSGGRSFAPEIARSLAWIDGDNELKKSLVCDSPGLVLRDIHRRGVGRVARAIRSAAWCWGLPGERGSDQPESLRINPECRPYHLGWILYAASLAGSLVGEPLERSCARTVSTCV